MVKKALQGAMQAHLLVSLVHLFLEVTNEKDTQNGNYMLVVCPWTIIQYIQRTDKDSLLKGASSAGMAVPSMEGSLPGWVRVQQWSL